LPLFSIIPNTLTYSAENKAVIASGVWQSHTVKEFIKSGTVPDYFKSGDGSLTGLGSGILTGFEDSNKIGKSGKSCYCLDDRFWGG